MDTQIETLPIVLMHAAKKKDGENLLVFFHIYKPQMLFLECPVSDIGTMEKIIAVDMFHSRKSLVMSFFQCRC